MCAQLGVFDERRIVPRMSEVIAREVLRSLGDLGATVATWRKSRQVGNDIVNIFRRELSHPFT